MLLARAIEVNRPTSCRLRRRLFLSKRVNDKENNGDTDTGIGHIERWPRMGEWHMQVEQQKIDHVPVKQTVGQISEHACEQERQRQIAPEIPCPPQRLWTVRCAMLVSSQEQHQREQ